jgi:hypothetical protein
VLIEDHHESYLSWQDYLAVEAKLAANNTQKRARPVREGVALCQGSGGTVPPWQIVDTRDNAPERDGFTCLCAAALVEVARRR